MQWLFDHVVIVVRDLDTTIRNYEAGGFSVVRGGRHPDTSAVNGLIGLDNQSYLELFSFSDPEKAPRQHANWAPFDRGGGFGSFWCRTNDIAQDITLMRAAGVRAEDGRAGSRMRPDGFEVKFRLSVPARDEFPHAPALIEDVTPFFERVPAAVAHRNAASHIAAITCRVPDLRKAAAFYSSMIGQGTVTATQASGPDTLSLRLGTTRLQLIEEPASAGLGQDVGVQAIEVQSNTGKRAVIGPNTAIPVFG